MPPEDATMEPVILLEKQGRVALIRLNRPAVFNALNDMKQPRAQWDCGTTGIGVLISDSLMFQRGQPDSSDRLSHLGLRS